MKGQTQDRQKDTGQEEEEVSAFKDQYVLLMDECEEVWAEHAPAGKFTFDSCHSSQIQETGSS